MVMRYAVMDRKIKIDSKTANVSTKPTSESDFIYRGIHAVS